MKRRAIKPKEASVAATFFEPVYQRLHLLRSENIDLICFTKETNDRVGRLLEQCGATPSARFRSGSFAEIWEVPHDEPLLARYFGTFSEFDQKISEALGCLGGRFSDACGHLSWGDIQEEPHRRRHFASRLLEEESRSTKKRSR